jgi:SAM-dependent methyltransferase
LLAATPLSFRLRYPRRTLGVVAPKVIGKLFERLPDDLQQRFVSISKSATVGGRQARLRIKFFESLRANIDSLKLPSGASAWARYYRTADKEYFQTELSPRDWRQKNESVDKILADTRSSSVLDVGANTGNYSRIAAANAARVTACEIDIAALTQCYDGARRDGLDILSLAANVFSTSPTPGRGGIACAAPVDRLRSDLVMGLAVIHHAVAVQRIPIARVCDIFTALTDRWLLLEYAAPLKPKIGADIVPGLDDYTISDLESCLRARFREVSRLPSFPEDRKLFLCAK